MNRAVDTLIELNISRNCIGGGSLEMLATAMKKSQSIKRLDLSHNNLKENAVTSLAALLRSNESRLKEVNLSSNSINDEDVSLLISSLESNDKVQTLDLEHNDMVTKEGWAAASKQLLKVVCNNTSVSEVIKSNHTLQSIWSPRNIELEAGFRWDYKLDEGPQPPIDGFFQQYLDIEEIWLRLISTFYRPS